jgi:SAM-dependent methyltransferase
MTGRVLVPGCGSGHDVRAIAQKKTALVVGMDIAPSAIRTASAFPVEVNESYILAACRGLKFEVPNSGFPIFKKMGLVIFAGSIFCHLGFNL